MRKLDQNPLRKSNFNKFWISRRAFTYYCHSGLGPLSPNKLTATISHTRRWYQYLFLSFFLFSFYVILCYFVIINFYKKYFYSIFFFHVSRCSGVFRVPGFIDTLCLLCGLILRMENLICKRLTSTWFNGLVRQTGRKTTGMQRNEQANNVLLSIYVSTCMYKYYS